MTPGAVVVQLKLTAPVADAVRMVVGVAHESVKVPGLMERPVGGIVLAVTFITCVAVQPFTGFITNTVYVALAVGDTTTADVVAPVTAPPVHV